MRSFLKALAWTFAVVVGSFIIEMARSVAAGRALDPCNVVGAVAVAAMISAYWTEERLRK